jgi:hypothetical protein
MKSFTHKPLATPLPELSAVTTEQARMYTTPDGNVYPSITTCLSVLSKEAIAGWRKRIGEEEAKNISEHASNRGTDLHACIEDHLQNKEVVFPVDKRSKVKIMFNGLKRILSNIDNIVAQEVPLYSDDLKVAGRCDCIGEYQGVLSIIDFKSATKAKRKEWIEAYFIQATAYSLMFEERTGINIEQIVILICGEEDFSAQVFVEQRSKFVDQLKDVIGQWLL